MSKNVTFIIPHKGREEMLEQTLSSILELDYELSEIEVLVISQNERLEVSGDIRFQKIGLNVIYPPQGQTISALRNIGAKEANGEYFAFLDADVALSRNWLTKMLELLAENPSRKLVSAMQVNSEEAPVLERIRTVLSNAEIDVNVSFLPGRNLFLHKSTFEQVGGFPEHLITCEDYFFTDKVNELGDLYYSSAAQYVHIGEDKELGSMYQKEVWRGQSNLQSIKGRRIPLRELPSFFVPPIMMVGLLVALLAAIGGASTLSSLGLAVFILPIIVYSVRLYRLSAKQIPLIEIIKFYVVYFPARAKGTILGVVRSFSVKETS